MVNMNHKVAPSFEVGATSALGEGEVNGNSAELNNYEIFCPRFNLLNDAPRFIHSSYHLSFN